MKVNFHQGSLVIDGRDTEDIPSKRGNVMLMPMIRQPGMHYLPHTLPHTLTHTLLPVIDKDSSVDWLS